MAQSFLLILILFVSFISTQIHACSETERTSLLSFAFTLSSPSLNWTSINCCNWEGITCNRDGQVTSLSLPSKGLRFKGGIFPLSSTLGNVTYLTHLNLSNNSLDGSLDQTGFFSTSFLEVIDLSYNLLSGEIPLLLPTSTNIKMVDFSHNNFSGPIPSSFFQQAKNLTSFSANDNFFSGPIPTSSICLQSSSLITILDFSSNEFNGSIPSGLGKCSKLKVFRARNNNLSGLLPDDIYNATTLEEITLPLNSLTGVISDKIANLTNLVILDLYFNQLSGVLPLHFGKISKLKFLLLHFNNLDGSLPPSFMNLTNLVELNLGVNHLEGNISRLNFSKLGKLTKLDLLRNNFSGSLPMSLYSCKSLKAIRLSSNNIEGQIQPEILSLKSLSFLSLSVNRYLTNMTGAMKILMQSKSLRVLAFSHSFGGEEVPTDLGIDDFDGFQNIRFLDLSFSKLTGQIPLWLNTLKKLEVLSLQFNKITGPIPSWLGTLPRLFHIDLTSNLIVGEFPKDLCRLPMIISQQTAAQVDDGDYLELPIYGTIDGEKAVQYNYLSRFPRIIYLALNTLEGHIPVDIGQLQLLHHLTLNGNNFSSNIPDEIFNIKGIRKLDLSINHFSGNIPPSVTNLTLLLYFNVSYNNLEGPIPKSTQLQSFTASEFEGNPKLCGAPLPNECQANKNETDDEHNHDVDNDYQLPWFYVPIAVGFVTGFWGVCGSLIFNKTWRYAFFRFIEHVQDNIYVMMLVRINKLKRRLSGS